MSYTKHHPEFAAKATPRKDMPAGERIGSVVEDTPFQVHPVYSGVILNKPYWSKGSKFVYMEFGFVVKGATRPNVIKLIAFERLATEALAFFQQGTRIVARFSLSSYATASYYGVRGVLIEYFILGDDKPFSIWISDQLQNSKTEALNK